MTRAPGVVGALLPVCVAVLACSAPAPEAEGGAGSGDLPAIRLAIAYPDLRFERPLALAAPADGTGRLFVAEQDGRIHRLPDDPAAQATSVFLDLAGKVRRVHEEEGLLSFAFHPRYGENGFLFVYYSASDPRRTVLGRFRVSPGDPDRIDPSSETVLLEVEQPYGNHNGGTVLFGPDGYLYLSLGDGGAAGDPEERAQDLSTLLGSILRIDVDRAEAGRAYAIPPDNPFVERAGARPEIWAYGLRNVWRMSFDRETGDLWAGDVGQDRWEEIDRIRKGGNYGWDLREGRHPFEPRDTGEELIDPVVEHPHPESVSVTGGYVYRGSRFPRLRGVYLYADFGTGRFWGLRHADGEVQAHAEVLRRPVHPASFGEGPDGELYVCGFDGRIYRVEAAEPG